MAVDRRQLLTGMSLGMVAGTILWPPKASAGQASLEDQIVALAERLRLPLELRNGAFSGPGWEHLIREAGAARMVLFGEDHGVAEIPLLAGQLFEALVPRGFSSLGIEISPPLAREVNRLLRTSGLRGLRSWFQRTRGVAFYTMAEEAAFLARLRSIKAGPTEMLFGLDYEVGGDEFIIERLQALSPRSAQDAVKALASASRESWAEFERTRNPSLAFPFSADPELVRRVRRLWANPSAEASELLDTLEKTLVINRLQKSNSWLSTLRRAEFNRANFVRWRAANARAGRAPKAMLKFGASHMMRSRNTTGHYDVGSLAAEAAIIDGGRSFHVLVVPVSGEQARFDPSSWRYRPVKAEMILEPLAGASAPGHRVLDLRPLRSIAGGSSAFVAQFIHGFDAAVFLANTTASSNLN